jgi:hypothetical protein
MNDSEFEYCLITVRCVLSNNNILIVANLMAKFRIF